MLFQFVYVMFRGSLRRRGGDIGQFRRRFGSVFYGSGQRSLVQLFGWGSALVFGVVLSTVLLVLGGFVFLDFFVLTRRREFVFQVCWVVGVRLNFAVWVIFLMVVRVVVMVSGVFIACFAFVQLVGVGFLFRVFEICVAC